MNPWAWHSALFSPREMPSYAITLPADAPALAAEAKTMNVLGTVRRRGKAAYARKTEVTDIRDRLPPSRSMMTSVLTSWSVKIIALANLLTVS